MIKVRRDNARMIRVKIAIENQVITILSVYSTNAVLALYLRKDLFYANLSVEIMKVHENV